MRAVPCHVVDVVLFRLLCSDLLVVAARGTARVMADVSFVLVPLWNLNVGMKPVFGFPGWAACRSNSLFIFRRILISGDVHILCEHSLHLSFVTVKVWKDINLKQIKNERRCKRKIKTSVLRDETKLRKVTGKCLIKLINRKWDRPCKKLKIVEQKQGNEKNE